jgi:hypothetical protein
MRSLTVAIVLALSAAGCETFGPRTCDRSPEGNPVVTYEGGAADDGGVYMSSPWAGELLWFPGGMRYALKHQLGVAPRWVQAYLSFDRFGALDGGVLAQASGNQVEIAGVDEETIEVVNDSCVDYWLLVVAGASGQAAP